MRASAILATLACVLALMPPAAGASERHPYAKIGIDTSGGESGGIGFADRLIFHGGIDLFHIWKVQIGPEVVYQRSSVEEQRGGMSVSATGTRCALFANGCLVLRPEWRFVPYAGAGFGLAYGSDTGRVRDTVVIEASDTDPALRLFGGVWISRFLVEAEISRVIQDRAETEVAINFGVRF